MGSDKAKDPQAYDDELPQHTVTLGAYRIGRTPVTNGQYKAFVDATGSQAPGHWSNGQIPRGKENHPVVYVSWKDATAFCEWAGVRLLSEAEWEKAARGTDGRIYPWGNEAPDANRCNFNNIVKNVTTTEGTLCERDVSCGASTWQGNVWEWVSSRYGSYPYRVDDGREDQSSTDVRVLRGGSWFYEAWYVRSADRNRVDPDDRYDDVGFRVASPGL
ncbi:MAG: formylglycine-generating enzyme family protein [Anaerolineae bacterium]|nr:formylglycine-generating enzyme family protein [Anaerolineae bacterium]